MVSPNRSVVHAMAKAKSVDVHPAERAGGYSPGSERPLPGIFGAVNTTSSASIGKSAASQHDDPHTFAAIMARSIRRIAV